MKISRFVSGSSVILAGWLVATYIYEVPAQRYPKLDKKVPTTAMEEPQQTPILATAHVKPAAQPTSFSR